MCCHALKLLDMHSHACVIRRQRLAWWHVHSRTQPASFLQKLPLPVPTIWIINANHWCSSSTVSSSKYVHEEFEQYLRCLHSLEPLSVLQLPLLPGSQLLIDAFLLWQLLSNKWTLGKQACFFLAAASSSFTHTCCTDFVQQPQSTQNNTDTRGS